MKTIKLTASWILINVPDEMWYSSTSNVINFAFETSLSYALVKLALDQSGITNEYWENICDNEETLSCLECPADEIKAKLPDVYDYIVSNVFDNNH